MKYGDFLDTRHPTRETISRRVSGRYTSLQGRPLGQPAIDHLSTSQATGAASMRCARILKQSSSARQCKTLSARATSSFLAQRRSSPLPYISFMLHPNIILTLVGCAQSRSSLSYLVSLHTSRQWTSMPFPTPSSNLSRWTSSCKSSHRVRAFDNWKAYALRALRSSSVV